jgi:hypothetical protein
MKLEEGESRKVGRWEAWFFSPPPKHTPPPFDKLMIPLPTSGEAREAPEKGSGEKKKT